MKNPLLLTNDDQTEGTKSPFCWWRTLEEFDQNGHFKIDELPEPLSKLSPRLRVLREMERLSFIAGEEGLDDLRHKLLSYRAADFWLPVGGVKKEDMDVPPVITLLLTGLTGAGKSACVNLMYSVLGRSGLIPFAQTSGGFSNYTTMYLEEHNVVRSDRSGFCVYDTRGLDAARMDEGLVEVSKWMSRGVHHNQPCHRPGDDESKALGSIMQLTASSFVKRKVNCVMVVADLSQIHKAFESGDMNSVEAVRDLFHLSAIKNSNENPIFILTHGDLLSAEDRINGRLKVCEYLGIPETSGAYDIPCLTEQGILAEESDPTTAFALTEAVYRALLQADRAHLPKKKFKDWIILFFKWIMWCIASFFAILANFFARFGHHRDHKLKM
ncbi:Unknown protein [Striga hermonthica]|uniref:Uncharacterized protein n=1 Tax=Striga hermonthica TaxID=68872 RepID=A0A9N7NH44_STRHE|nr:Unknown protein [Striga hermonthica]